MPVYVYRNLRTGETFEVEQRITESAWTEHPESGDPVKRLVQPVGIAFKGSGFYVNDARGASKKAAASTGGDAGAAKGDGKSDGKSDASSGGGTKASSGGTDGGGATKAAPATKASA